MMPKDILENTLTVVVCIINLRLLFNAFAPWASQEAWNLFVTAALPLMGLLAVVSLLLLHGLDKEGFPRTYHGALAWPLLGTPLSLLVIRELLTPAALWLPALIGLGLSGLGIAQDWRDWQRWRKPALLLNAIWAVWGYWFFTVLSL